MPDKNKPSEKSFADLVRERPEIFDDMDCRPGPGDSDEEYLRAILPENLRHLTHQIIEARRKRHEADAAQEGEADAEREASPGASRER
jgi:hypothetical protein